MYQKLHWAITLLILLVIIGFVSFNLLSKSNKIAYVDALKLVSNYEGMKIAKAELQSKFLTYQKNIDTLKMELSSKSNEYTSRRSTLSAGEKKLFEEVLSAKEQQLVNYQNMVQEKAQEEDLELTQKALDKINTYVKQYGEQHGYELILAATQYGNIVYGYPDVDITDEIIEGLNVEYKGPR
jgi:outer membrane protein